MKTFQILGTGALLPSLSFALVGNDWSLSGAPSGGVKDIIFPMFMPNAPHQAGYYFAQQFAFLGTNSIGYTGLQPRVDDSGGPVIHAVFSSFIDGSTTSDPNCHSGADGGAGVSCSVEANLSYDDHYELWIQNTECTTWTGTLVDLDTGDWIHIGTYTLPAGATGIDNYQVGFMEYYFNNGNDPKTCPDLPFAEVTFGAPTTSSPGVIGQLGVPYEYGDCIGQVNFTETKIGSSFIMDVGWRNASY